jgi:hypothetical protein
MFAPIHGFNRNYRACPMAVHAEALRAGVRTGSGLRALSAVLIVAVAWGLLCGFAADIHLNYQWGAASKADPPYVSTIFGREPYDHVTNLIRVGIAPAQRQSAVLAMGAGFTIALVLGAARLSVPGFLLHPVGYAISANWCMSLMWFSLTVAWVVKASLLRFGGNRAFRRSQPLFLGIVLGECTAGSIWMLVSAFTGTKTFIVWPYG